MFLPLTHIIIFHSQTELLTENKSPPPSLFLFFQKYLGFSDCFLCKPAFILPLYFCCDIPALVFLIWYFHFLYFCFGISDFSISALAFLLWHFQLFHANGEAITINPFHATHSLSSLIDCLLSLQRHTMFTLS